MIKKRFAIWDSKVECYPNDPFYARTTAEGIRIFSDAVNSRNTALSAHPGDFGLFELGESDNVTGKTKDHHTPVSLGLAMEYLVAEFPEANLELVDLSKSVAEKTN